MCLHPLGNALLPLSSVGCFAEGILFVSRKGGRRFLVAAGPPQSCRFDGDRGGWEGARRARHATGNRRLGYDGRCEVRTKGASQDRGISQNAAVKTPARWLGLEVSPCTSQRCWKRRNKRRDNKQSRLRSSVRISGTMITNDLGVYHGLFFPSCHWQVLSWKTQCRTRVILCYIYVNPTTLACWRASSPCANNHLLNKPATAILRGALRFSSNSEPLFGVTPVTTPWTVEFAESAWSAWSRGWSLASSGKAAFFAVTAQGFTDHDGLWWL